ncbi:MAG: sterol desaturase family protein [Sphingomonadales bacterium]|nr:sterol desaturase family protein [Sphingomonadales bacterium]MDE2168076.1 sterol desaturase family protein [Sphingomonadales bacterium]
MVVHVPPIFYATLPSLLMAGVLVVFETLRGGPARDGWRNLQIWAVEIAASLAFLPCLPGWAGPGLIDTARLPVWQGFLIFLVVRDGCECLFHYAQHRIPFLWAMHSLHHSDPNMGTLTTSRHFWADPLLKQMTIWAASLIIVSPTPTVFLLYGLASLWNFLTHAHLPIDFGRFSWLLNCPAYHRRHHSILREHYDQNFAAILPIFDVMLGTYRRPDGYPQTGLERAPCSLGEVLIWPLIWDKPRRAAIAPAEALPSNPHLQP